jgi:hypothetical protein
MDPDTAFAVKVLAPLLFLVSQLLLPSLLLLASLLLLVFLLLLAFMLMPFPTFCLLDILIFRTANIFCYWTFDVDWRTGEIREASGVLSLYSYTIWRIEKY